MNEKTAFVCDEITPEMMALDEAVVEDAPMDIQPEAAPVMDAEPFVTIERRISVDPRAYRSDNYTKEMAAPLMDESDEDLANDIAQAEENPEAEKDEETTPEGGVAEGQAMDAAPAKKMFCKADFEKCKAKNPILCPYHGCKLIETDISNQLKKTIPSALVNVRPDKRSPKKGETYQDRGKYFLIRIKVPRSQKQLAEKALDKFLSQPGIKNHGQKDWDPSRNEWSEYYDVDLLMANKKPAQPVQQQQEEPVQPVTEANKPVENAPIAQNAPQKPQESAVQTVKAVEPPKVEKPVEAKQEAPTKPIQQPNTQEDDATWMKRMLENGKLTPETAQKMNGLMREQTALSNRIKAMEAKAGPHLDKLPMIQKLIANARTNLESKGKEIQALRASVDGSAV